MNNCIYCSAMLSDKGVFCPQCAKQSKCKSCSELLEVNAKACVVCGTLIGNGNSNSISQTNHNVFENIFELNETTEFDGGKSSRNMRLGCSNEAVSNFGDFVERRIRGTQAIGNTRVEKDNYPPQGNVLPPLSTSGDYFETNGSETGESDVTSHTENLENNHLSEKEILHKIFRKVDNKWKLDEIELKAGSKLEYARRLTFLFLYLNHLEGNLKTSRTF